ncbi:MAG: hypothetical protein WCK73_02645 [Deltaproteobacteria bacterium]
MKAAQPKILLAALAALLAAGSASAADAPAAPQAPPLQVVGEYKTKDSTVIVVEQEKKALRDTTAWAYPERGLTFFPDGPGKDKDRWAIGAMWWVAPFFTAQYTRGLGSGFSVDAEVLTIVLFNQLTAGGQWAFHAGPFSLGVMAHVGAYYGSLGKALIETTSFNSSGWGVLVNPGAKVGLQVERNAWITLQYEAYLTAYQATYLGGMVLSPSAPAYSGFGLTAMVEYSPAKTGVIYYGFSVYNTAANYPIYFNVEATASSESFNVAKIWYFGIMAGYEF